MFWCVLMCVCLGKINTSQSILQCSDLPYELSRYVCFVCVFSVCVYTMCVSVYFGHNGKIKKYCWLRKICVAWRKTCGKAKKFFMVFFCKYFRLYFSAFSLVFFVGILKWVCRCVWVWLWYWLCWQQHRERERVVAAAIIGLTSWGGTS